MDQSEAERQKHFEAVREARRQEYNVLTAELKQTNLVLVMQRVFNMAGDPSGANAIKFRCADGTLLCVFKNEQRFYSLNDRPFASLNGLRRGSNAIDLVLAVNETLGASTKFADARLQLQREFRPETIQHAGQQKEGGPRIEVGEINLPAFFFQGNVVHDGSKHYLVASGWNDKERRNGAMRVVECDEHGMPKKGAVETPTSLAPEGFYNGKRETHGVMTLVHSAHPMLPDGIQSNDPALMLVPFGPFKGQMLGQLTEQRLTELRSYTQSEPLRAAIAETRPQRLQFVPKVQVRKPEAEIEEFTLPEPSKLMRYNGKTIDILKLTRDYLVKQRGLDPAVVEGEIARGAVFPTEYKGPKLDENDQAIEGQWHHEPAYGNPAYEWGTGKPIGFQKKILFQDPEEARRMKGDDSRNVKAVPRGYMRIGEWNENTLEAVVVEAWLDGLSYKQLRNPPATTCIWVTYGARVPRQLIEDCAKRDIKLVAALDNDHTGRKTSEDIATQCECLGVRFAHEIPGITPIVPGRPAPLSEIKLELWENDIGRTRMQDLKNYCEAKRIMLTEQPGKIGWLSVTLDNTREACEVVAQLKAQDDIARSKDGRTKKEKWVKARWENKDWNDILLGRYRRTFSKAEEREFKETAAPAEVTTPEVNAERHAIRTALKEAAAGVNFAPEAQAIFLRLTSERLKAENREIDSLTVRDLRDLTIEAARQQSEIMDRRMLREAPVVNEFDPLTLVGDFERLQRDYQKASPEQRAEILRETDRRADAIGGPGTTGVALRNSAKDFVVGKESKVKLTSRAVRHAGAIAEQLQHGLRPSPQNHAHTR